MKETSGCKIVLNLRDPINYTLVNGLKLDQKFHVSREKQERKYLEQMDLILTSSKSNRDSLRKKNPDLASKIRNNYFGYIKDVDIDKNSKNPSNKLRIGYGGVFGNKQKPESIIKGLKLSKHKEKVKVYFIGIHKDYRPVSNHKNDPQIHFYDSMPHSDFLEFMTENIDVAFLPLSRDYIGACVPSKLYEYINLGLPILGALPEGDAKIILEENMFGIFCHYDDHQGLADAIDKMIVNPNLIPSYRESISIHRHKWAMDKRFLEVNKLLKTLQ